VACPGSHALAQLLTVIGVHTRERFRVPRRELLERVLSHDALWASEIL